MKDNTGVAIVFAIFSSGVMISSQLLFVGINLGKICDLLRQIIERSKG